MDLRLIQFVLFLQINLEVWTVVESHNLELMVSNYILVVYSYLHAKSWRSLRNDSFGSYRYALLTVFNHSVYRSQF